MVNVQGLLGKVFHTVCMWWAPAIICTVGGLNKGVLLKQGLGLELDWSMRVHDDQRKSVPRFFATTAYRVQ